MATEHSYTVVIEIGDDGSTAEKEQLLDHMVERIGEENAVLGQATARVTSVEEQNGE
jgi:hypothetical protein